jgi:hypothetical protein
MFASSRLKSLFFPPTACFIRCSANSRCSTIACVHFGRQSSLANLKSSLFSELFDLFAITIPSSVKCIDHCAFQMCFSLRIVQFELPSQCWSICADTFEKCANLEPISLPSSIEFIDSARLFPSTIVSLLLSTLTTF